MLALSLLLSIAGSACLVTGMTLESRAAQSQAICTSDFAWMQNTKLVSPCQAASSVDAFCNNGNWIIHALNATASYANPNTTSGTASQCTCSWASYNLLSACIACQGFPEQTPAWSVYSSQCLVSQLSDTFFPTNLVLPSDVAIPAWAQTNPTTWPGQIFSATQAKVISAEGLPDFVGGVAVATEKKKNNIGAIVGGVIGGLVVLLGAVFIAVYIIRRQRRSAPSSLARRPDGHMRSLSDVTAASNLKLQEGLGYRALDSNSTPMHPPTSPTMMTHNSSERSFRLFQSRANNLSYSTTTSPPPTQPTSTATPASGRREDIVEPYILPPALHNPDSKQALGTQRIYDHPSAPPPMRVDSTRPHTPTSQGGRRNPPTYALSVGESSSAPRPHRKQPSTDTMHSLTSSRNGGQYGHTHNLSGSAIQEERPSGHGRQLSGPSVNEKYQHESTVVGNHDLA